MYLIGSTFAEQERNEFLGQPRHEHGNNGAPLADRPPTAHEIHSAILAAGAAAPGPVGYTGNMAPPPQGFTRLDYHGAGGGNHRPNSARTRAVQVFTRLVFTSDLNPKPYNLNPTT